MPTQGGDGHADSGSTVVNESAVTLLRAAHSWPICFSSLPVSGR
jgi:hypothetical protein